MKKMTRVNFVAFFIGFLALFFSSNLHSQECTVVEIRDGQASFAEWTPETDWNCYRLDVREEAAVEVALTPGNALLTILTGKEFLVEEAKIAEFQAHPNLSYELRVGPPYRMPSDEYVLTIKVKTGGATSNWSYTLSKGSVLTEAVSTSGSSKLHGTCASSRGEGYHFNLVHTGGGLQKVDDGTEIITVVFDGRPGRTISYSLTFNYFEPELTHVLIGNLTPKFLNDFAASNSMTFRNQSDEELAVFDLKGSSKLRNEIKSRCGA